MPESTQDDVRALYMEHGPMVRRRVRRFFGEHEAQEVCQEVFVKIIERYATFRGESSTLTWVYRLTTNHCLNRLRDSRRRQELLAQYTTDAAYLDQPYSSDAYTQLLCKQLWRQLDDELLKIFVYYHVDGMTQQEIADVTGVSDRTISNRLAKLAEQARAYSKGI